MFSRSRNLVYTYSKHFLNLSMLKVSSAKLIPILSNISLQLYSQSKISAKTETKEKNVQVVNKYVNRTHTCGELTLDNSGEYVQLCGWIEYRRLEKFLTLRDSYGSTQCFINEDRADLTDKLNGLSFETVLSLKGRVLPRPKEHINKKVKTGEIEIHVDSIEVLNSSMSQLPFYIRNYNKAKESLQMKYRYLALRFPELQRNLRIRSGVTMKMREFLIHKCGFVDIATPTLFRKTPGGAQEFVVPTKQPEKFYSLVQSPQQFKQLLMIGGMDRYFQFAQCYRDEGSRSDRQPEFTQLDIEMSFVDRDGIMSMTEELIINSWPEFLNNLHAPFKRLTYEEAMESYGSDCPDLRIPGKIYNLSSIIDGPCKLINKSSSVYVTKFNEKGRYLTKSVKEALNNLSKQVFTKANLIQINISDLNLPELDKFFSESDKKCIKERLNLKKDDVLIISYGPISDARQLIGKVRVEFTNILELKGEIIRMHDYEFVWIYDFPLFTFNTDTNLLETTHHPFTQPHPEDMKIFLSDPVKVRGLQYDLVMNGSEIAGGSIRIHQKMLQKHVLDILNIDASNIYYLLEALDSGAPPHGGIALGLDRYISLICNTSSIRDVIAFPKTMEGRDLMSGAPSSISEEDKNLYNL